MPDAEEVDYVDLIAINMCWDWLLNSILFFTGSCLKCRACLEFGVFKLCQDPLYE